MSKNEKDALISAMFRPVAESKSAAVERIAKLLLEASQNKEVPQLIHITTLEDMQEWLKQNPTLRERQCISVELPPPTAEQKKALLDAINDHFDPKKAPKPKP